LSTVAREKKRAILATKPGQEVIVLEHGDRPAGVRLAFQVAPGSDLGELSARLSKAGLKSETRSDITPGIAQAIVFADPQGHQRRDLLGLFVRQGRRHRRRDHAAQARPRRVSHARRGRDREILLRRARVQGVGLAQRFLRLPALQPRSPHHQPAASRQCQHSSPRLRAARRSRDQPRLRLLARKDIKLFWGPIRHLIGHNIAIYHKNPDGITVEFFTDLDQMHDEELGYFEPRPWHQDRPQRPKVWGDDTPTNYWGPGHPHDMPGPKK
jgi:hypothetical protein